MVCKFPAQFYAREKKNILKIQKTVELVLIIIACTLEILSAKYEKYQYCHWNTCLSSFFPWQCFKKTSSNSKYNGFIRFLYFFYLMSLKAKYGSLVVRKITRAVDKDNNWPKHQFSKPWWCSKELGMRWLSKQFETVSESQEFHRKLRKVLCWSWWPI